MAWGSILSGLVSAFVGSILSALRKRRMDKERIEDAKVRAKLETQNEALKEAEEARRRAASVDEPDHNSLIDRMRKGDF